MDSGRTKIYSSSSSSRDVNNNKLAAALAVRETRHLLLHKDDNVTTPQPAE